MRNPRFKEFVPNYRKSVFEVTLEERGKLRKYNLPFYALEKWAVSSKNKVVSFKIYHDLNNQGILLKLADGSKVDFSSDLVLYYCDPKYDWSPLNQIKRALKGKLNGSRLSTRVIADAMKTSPAQVVRLFKTGQTPKQIAQLAYIAELVGYRLNLTLEKKSAKNPRRHAA